MRLKTILILFFATILSSCESNEITIDADNLLLGNWVAPIYDGETTTFERSNALPNEAYGITFKQNGDFIERTSGFCGTPPLIFSDFEGSFEINETLIKVTTDFYPNFFQWRIIELSATKLVVKRELSEQEKEHRALMDLYNELSELAYNKTCSNASEWTFTAYGSKACGGPQGYIPYSKNIDVASFLQKIEAYSEAEKKFNIKWGIISDCAIINPPKNIECQNEYPILIY